MTPAELRFWPSAVPIIVYRYYLYVIVDVSASYKWIYARPIGAPNDVSVTPIKPWECMPLTPIARELVASVVG